MKVLDFGLAKAFQPDASDVSESMSPTISLTAAATQMGMVIGTAAYMAPEQASGNAVDKRADVWAFGVVLYEMLTGQRLFSGKDVSHTLAGVLMKEIEWTTLPARLPESLGRVLRRCLEREPKQRLRDIGEARIELDSTAAAPTATPMAAAPSLQLWQRPMAAVGIPVIAVLITIFAGWTLTQPSPQAVTRFEVPLRAAESFNGAGRHYVAVSPDGRQIVYNTTDGLSLRSLDQVTPVLVAGTDGNAREPFFSADGAWIGFYAAGQLKKVAVSGGAAVTLGDADNSFGASWGADDMILYGQGSNGIWQVPGTSGPPEMVIAVEDGELAHGPQMLPGDEWVLFTLRPAGVTSWDESQIVMQSLATGERIVLIEGGRDARSLETGHLVYGLNGVVFAVAFDLDAREVLGGPVPLVEGVGLGVGAIQLSVARNGSLVYVPGASGGAGSLSLTWVSRAGEETPTAAPPRAYGDIRVSPDGTRIAVGIADPDNIDIWIWRLDQGPLTRLTFAEGFHGYPLWTPDNECVVFASSRDGGGLFWKAADGTGEVEQLLESTDGPRPWGWSADGRLVFDQGGDIGVLSIEGDRTVEMLLETEFQELEPALSPDGRWLAYRSDEAGQPNIYVQPFPNIDDGKWQVSTNFGFDPVWLPDGRALFFQTANQLMIAQVETEPTFNPGTPTAAFSINAYLGGGGGRRYDLAPDGERFLMRKIGGQTAGEDAFTGMIVVENWFEELRVRVPVP